MEEKASFIRKRKKVTWHILYALHFVHQRYINLKKTDNPAHLLIDLYPTREKGLNGEIAC